uniref:Uncharacterized protein n=1 Tax=Angiostrongylus cantonensis TaxID=6313 RepID=A0A0K0D9V8_ANGCA
MTCGDFLMHPVTAAILSDRSGTNLLTGKDKTHGELKVPDRTKDRKEICQTLIPEWSKEEKLDIILLLLLVVGGQEGIEEADDSETSFVAPKRSRNMNQNTGNKVVFTTAIVVKQFGASCRMKS